MAAVNLHNGKGDGNLSGKSSGVFMSAGTHQEVFYRLTDIFD